nr:AAA domain-containing protein [Calorimonas adulescens]
MPVVSTTFASVSTFLKYIGKEELGILVIDEAGQATPQSALGAIWRTSKAIVIGDPMQIEPIVTVPDVFYEKFAEKLAKELNILIFLLLFNIKLRNLVIKTLMLRAFLKAQSM